MPVYQTPASIDVIIEIEAADVRITAADRTDTTVEVLPRDAAKQSEVEAAGQIAVDYADGTLRVIGPKHTFDFSRRSRWVTVSIEVPSGSTVAAKLGAGDVRCAGRLGETRVKTGAGNISAAHTGPLHADTGAGHLTAERIDGDADLRTGTGRIQVGTVGGDAIVKSANGDTTVDTITGTLRVRSANGEIRVESAAAGVDAKTSNGAIRLGEVRTGAIVLGTGNGDLDIGIAEGAAAWLEVNTGFGRVRNELTDAAGPGDADRTVEVRGRTAYGDITVHRA
jgi:hypothetical protein